MYQFPSFYELGNTCSDSYNSFLHEFINSSSSEMFNNNNINYVESSSVNPRSMAEAKAIAANKSHSEAERRRRKRINGHLVTLRTLLPNTIKTDKASLLAEAVRCVRELKKTTSELGVATTMSEDDDDNDNDHTTFMKTLMFPSESDELNISYCRSSNNNSIDNLNETLIIKASICCEDRPEIMMDLRRALSSVQGKVVRAEMSTVGGRIKCILWLEMLENGCKEGLLVQLRRALKVVMDKNNFGPQNMGQDLLGNKRPRLLGGPMNYI